MSKGKIITLSIVIFIITLITILFGVVFCLRKQSVVVVGAELDVSNEEILSAAEIKNGTPIFMLNKDEAISKIETAHPYVKVIQIKTTSVMEIEIVVRKRVKMYYANAIDKFFVLDEDLKVLNIFETEPTELTKIDDTLQINNNTKIGDFVGSDLQKQVAYDLFVAMYENAQINKDEYMDREDICKELKQISFAKGNSLTVQYDAIIMKTASGVELEIWKPEENLGQKIKICFSTIRSGKIENLAKIVVYYDNDGVMQTVYQQV